MPFPLSISYPQHPYPSYWGPVTANTNFCEIDHQFSPHIAELVNTLSNVVYLVYAVHGLRLLRRRGRLNLITALPHLGLVAVGLGSAAYHATLLKVPQLADEIGMAVPTGAIVSRLVSFRVRDRTRRHAVYGLSVALITAVYVVHCVSFSNWIHYPAFGLMIHLVGRRCVWLINRIDDPTLRRKVRRQALLGEALFVAAFAIWLVDRLCCDRLIRTRARLGLPWGWLLELHGWWHVGTGMGAFVFIAVSEFLMENFDHGQDSDGIRQKSLPDPGTRLSPFAVGVVDGSDDDGDGNGVHVSVQSKKKI